MILFHTAASKSRAILVFHQDLIVREEGIRSALRITTYHCHPSKKVGIDREDLGDKEEAYHLLKSYSYSPDSATLIHGS